MADLVLKNRLMTAKPKKKSLKEKYFAYCDAQTKDRTLWYLIPLITLSAGAMPIGICLMSYFTWYIPFVALSILLFFANMILHIAEQSTRITISCYILALLFNLLSPVISFLVLVCI